MTKNQQKYILPTLVLGVAVVFILMTYLVKFFNGADEVYYDLTPGVSADFVSASGERSSDIPAAHIILRTGDLVEYHIRMPEREPLSDPVLCFADYNCTIRVEFAHRTLYVNEGEGNTRHKFMGDLLVRVRIPEEAYGQDVTVTIRHAQRIPASHVVTFGLMSASDAWKYPILGHEAEFVIFFAMLFLSLILLVFMLLVSATDHRQILACLLLLFTLLVSAWYLGYNRFFYVLSTRARFNARVEYFALSYAPIPLLGYIIAISHKGVFRRIYQGLFLAFCGLSVFSTTATLLPVDISFNDTLQILQTLLIVFACVLAVHLIVTRFGTRADQDSRIFLYGFTAAAGFAALQVLSFWIRDANANLPDWLRSFLRTDFASIGVLAFVGTLAYSYATRSMEKLVRQVQEDELQKLAYEDLLSGIHNRVWCVQQMEQIPESGKDYTVVFMDADGLKAANDTYGHETGDLLIRTVAQGIRESFGQSRGFYGRWGGDEFVAFFYEREEAEAFAGKFREYQKSVNDAHTLPFPFSVSLGLCGSGEIPGAAAAGGQVTPTMVINEADRRMYLHKRASKKTREDLQSLDDHKHS